MRTALMVASAGIIGACVAIYLAAVGIAASVRDVDDWWPYPWLWALVALAALSGIVWIVAALRDAPRPKPQRSRTPVNSAPSRAIVATPRGPVDDRDSALADYDDDDDT